MKKPIIAAVVALIPSVALAHTGEGAAHGFEAGFAHPFMGLDHILAMVAVGLLAVIISGRALWAVPSMFVIMMAAGSALGRLGFAVPMVEFGIALSVLVLGAMVVLGHWIPVVGAIAAAGFFAVFHGFAHGAEMPGGQSVAGYSAGFVLATALLHILGIGFGIAGAKACGPHSARLLQAAGSLTAVLGLGLASGVL